MRQQRQVCQHFFPIGDGSEGQLKPNEVMHDDLIVVKQLLQPGFRLSQMVDPNGGIDESHGELLFAPAAGCGFCCRVATAESSQTPGGFTTNEAGESFSYQSCLLLDAGVLLCLPDKLVVQSDCCAHEDLNMPILASF